MRGIGHNGIISKANGERITRMRWQEILQDFPWMISFGFHRGWTVQLLWWINYTILEYSKHFLFFYLSQNTEQPKIVEKLRIQRDPNTKNNLILNSRSDDSSIHNLMGVFIGWKRKVKREKWSCGGNIIQNSMLTGSCVSRVPFKYYCWKHK